MFYMDVKTQYECPALLDVANTEAGPSITMWHTMTTQAAEKQKATKAQKRVASQETSQELTWSTISVWIRP